MTDDVRTLGAIRERYEAERNKILLLIQNRECSASMSGIEHYPKPWDELDMLVDYDWCVVRTNLTWNPVTGTHRKLA